MAIKALAWMVRVFEPPVYCYHEIVHNQLVVDRFRRLGVVFVDDVSEVPEGAPLMLSAHGSAPEVVAAARGKGGFVVDAVCPLVTKVHHEVKVRAGKGYSIVYVGHEGHDEAVGTMAVAPEAIHLVESDADVADLPDPGGPVALLAQTTLSHHDWAGVLEAARKRFPELWMPGRSDLCFATTNRQSALTRIAESADAIVVIGSANSSNTVALEKVAKAAGCPRVYRVNRADELPDDLSRHGRRHRRGVGARGAGHRRHRPPGPGRGRRAGVGHRRGRVLPAAPGAARAAGGPRHRRERQPGRRRRRRRRPSPTTAVVAASDVLAALAG